MSRPPAQAPETASASRTEIAQKPGVVELLPAPRRDLVPAPGGKVRTPSLTTSAGILREMARVYRAVRAGQLASDEGTRRVYILDRMAKVIETAILEERVAQLEDVHGPK